MLASEGTEKEMWTKGSSSSFLIDGPYTSLHVVAESRYRIDLFWEGLRIVPPPTPPFFFFMEGCIIIGRHLPSCPLLLFFFFFFLGYLA